MHRKKCCLIFLLSIALAFSFLATPADSFAASGKTKKMTAYHCIKKGNNAYCVARWHIYKVNLKTGKVKRLKTPENKYPEAIKIKGKYLYCSAISHGIEGACIFRVNLKTNKYKILSKYNGTYYIDGRSFVINGSRIYYDSFKWKNGNTKTFRKCMKLNGKDKKATKYKGKMKLKESNANGYSVYGEWDEETYAICDYYLETPDQTYYVGREGL